MTWRDLVASGGAPGALRDYGRAPGNGLFFIGICRIAELLIPMS